MATTTIIGILAMVVLPTAKTAHRRAQEIELRRALREIRDAIDEHRHRCINLPSGANVRPMDGVVITCQGDGYPQELRTLVEGADRAESVEAKKVRFLRSIPVDPLTSEAEWGLRCLDKSEATDQCRTGIWDVFSKSEMTALDGKTKYKDF
jgi:general secretion pathway protein G